MSEPFSSINPFRTEKTDHTFPAGLEKTPEKLRYGIDSLLLAAYVCRILEDHFPSGKKVPGLVELGSGDGFALIGILTKWNVPSDGIEINKDMHDRAVKNARNFSLENICFLNMDLVNVKKEPLLKEWENNTFLVLANPPWRLPQETRRSSNKTRNMALWANEDTLKIFCAAASFLLKHAGQFCSIINPGILPSLLKEMEKSGLGLRRILPIYPYEGKSAIRLLLSAQKNAKMLPELLPPLILHYNTDNNSIWSRAALDFCPWLGSLK